MTVDEQFSELKNLCSELREHINTLEFRIEELEEANKDFRDSFENIYWRLNR